MHFYDKRGGEIETAIKDGQQGLGLTKGSEKRFEAQQTMVRLGTLGFLLRNARGRICHYYTPTW
jgi:hypothetical protein